MYISGYTEFLLRQFRQGICCVSSLIQQQRQTKGKSLRTERLLLTHMKYMLGWSVRGHVYRAIDPQDVHVGLICTRTCLPYCWLTWSTCWVDLYVDMFTVLLTHKKYMLGWSVHGHVYRTVDSHEVHVGLICTWTCLPCYWPTRRTCWVDLYVDMFTVLLTHKKYMLGWFVRGHVYRIVDSQEAHVGLICTWTCLPRSTCLLTRSLLSRALTRSLV